MTDAVSGAGNGNRLLIAGIGNLFFGDDGFGVEVARVLAAQRLRDQVVVRDFGIAGIHLAYELLEPHALLLVIDAMSRGGSPGTVYLVEPSLEPGSLGKRSDAHGMDLRSVFDSVLAMGGSIPRTLIVGCEPAELSPGIGLSPPVQHAVATAVNLVREVIDRELALPSATKEVS